MNYNELDLNLIKTFLAVYDNKSILGASKKLFVSQPAVTANIKRLEDFLSSKLFVRKSKGVMPTTEGDLFYNSCKEITGLLNNSINTLSQYNSLEKGTIHIGSSSTIIRRLLLPFISEFTNKYPSISITITDAIHTQLLSILKKGEVDLAIMSAPIDGESLFNKVVLTTTTDCFIAKKDFEKDFLDKEELKKYPLLVQKKPSNNRDYFETMCQENNIELLPKYEIGSFGLITDFVEQGMGIAFTIRDFVALDIKKGKVKEIQTNFKIKPREVLALTNKSLVNSFATSTFIKELKKYFEK